MSFSNSELNTINIVPFDENSPFVNRAAGVEDTGYDAPEARRDANGTCYKFTQTIGTYKRNLLIVGTLSLGFISAWYSEISDFNLEVNNISSGLDDYDDRNLSCLPSDGGASPSLVCTANQTCNQQTGNCDQKIAPSNAHPFSRK